MHQKLKKIAITGPESTGKSILTQQLAAHFNATYINEFAREYIDQLGRPYLEEDILRISKNQMAAEKVASDKAETFLFCDTELLVARIWSLHKYGRCHPWIDQQIQSNRYDLILLCDIDLPWEYDPQRENPDNRDFFFDWFKSELKNFKMDFKIVSGLGAQRLQNAIKIIDNTFSSGINE
jgi:NadR type nicotinamide-nucleotide adenylyltransferase